MEAEPIELTILMPCLNEAETIGICVTKAWSFLERSAVVGEVLVADNGSTDGSQAIAVRAGARVLEVPERGYGAALLGGIQGARGRFVIMGDADDSYDFSALDEFLNALRKGADLVMGNRFAGGIADGAMPFLHRYLGNPVLSYVGRLFFRTKIRDFHCGLRGFNRERIISLGLKTSGMEFASEMVVRASLAGLRIRQVPTTLQQDGRSRPPHLRTWRDGWRHLRFLLIYCPRWLFLYPAVFFMAFGVTAAAVLLPGPLSVWGVTFDTHSFIVACLSMLVGLQSFTFAIIARRLATARGLIPLSPRYHVALTSLTLERMLVLSLLLLIAGGGGFLWTVLQWAHVDFGPLEERGLYRSVVLSFTSLAASIQLAFTAFLSSVIDVSVIDVSRVSMKSPPFDRREDGSSRAQDRCRRSMRS